MKENKFEKMQNLHRIALSETLTRESGNYAKDDNP